MFSEGQTVSRETSRKSTNLAKVIIKSLKGFIRRSNSSVPLSVFRPTGSGRWSEVVEVRNPGNPEV
jgi:hypothetical protein